MKMRIFNDIRLTVNCIPFASETIIFFSQQSLKDTFSSKDTFSHPSLFQCFINAEQLIGGTHSSLQMC